MLDDRSFAFVVYALTARVICKNAYYKPFLPRRRGQFFLRTWHGGGAYKRVGRAEKLPAPHRFYIRMQQQGASLYTSSSEAFTRMTLREAFDYRGEVLETGLPRNDALLDEAARNEAARRARAALGLGDEPLIVYCWGSLGAREMNKKIARFMKREQDDGTPYRHIHATGSFGWRWMPEYVKEQGVDLKSHPRLDMREYIYDMPQVMAAADLIICRAGAATIAEVCASATPCIMVPSPNVTDNHQEKNARVLEKNGAAVVIRENECDGDSLYEAAKQLLSDRERCRAMRSAAANLAVVDAAERIYQTALELYRR